jgi:hypothetical protein
LWHVSHHLVGQGLPVHPLRLDVPVCGGLTWEDSSDALVCDSRHNKAQENGDDKPPKSSSRERQQGGDSKEHYLGIAQNARHVASHMFVDKEQNESQPETSVDDVTENARD